MGSNGFAWFVFFFIVYAIFLSGVAYKNIRGNSKIINYFSASFNPLVLSLSFAATLYSAFFMVGLPGFLYVHGIGAWPYIILGDVVGVLVLYVVGKKFIESQRSMESNIISPLQIIPVKNDKLLSITYVLAVSVFMIPYLALQLIGIGSLVASTTDGKISPMFASGLILITIWIYSSIGGIRAIVFSDVIQGVILFSLLAGVGAFVSVNLGGPIDIISKLNQVSPEHLSLPGPHGFFGFTTLLSFFFVVMLIPISQPQFLTRYILISDKRNIEHEKKLRSVCVGMCLIFSIISLPIVLIGLGGASEFLGTVEGDSVVPIILTEYCPVWLGSLFAVAVLAAAMSTSDSVLFSLAQIMSQNVFKVNSTNNSTQLSEILASRLYVLVVAVIAFIFSFVSSSPLILTLGSLAFSGCVIVVPFLYFGLFHKSNLTELRMSLYVPVICFLLLILSDTKKFLGFDVSLWAALSGVFVVLLNRLIMVASVRVSN